MSESAPSTPSAKKPPGPWLGVAGCGIVFSLALLGAMVGGWIAWMNPAPPPPPTTEYPGLGDLVNLITHLAVGAMGGGAVGLVVSGVILVMLFRNRRIQSVANIENSSQS